jgi:hypothetical protein
MLLASLEGVRKTSDNKWQARCPSHKDKSPSLGIKLDGDKILVKCWAGCGAVEVLSSIGLEWSDLFPDKPDTGKYIAPRFSKSEFFDVAIKEANIMMLALMDVMGQREISRENWERVLVSIEKLKYMNSEVKR